MKYLLVVDHIGTGGAERILVDYHDYLIKQGHQVKVFCLSGRKGQSKLDIGLEVVYGASYDVDNLLGKSWQQVMLFRKLRIVVSQFSPDVIFSFLEKSNLLVSLAGIQYTKVKSGMVRKVLYAMIRWMYNKCPNVVSVSKQVKDDLVASFGVYAKNIHVINNYVDKKDICRKAKDDIDNYAFDPTVRYVMNVGRFSDQKAQWKLLKAFSLYLKTTKDRVKLVLMGQGEYTDKLKKLADDLQISGQVDFLPFNSNPYKYMAHAHLFVLSSIFEGFPIVLAEVSSLRIPFVGTRKAIPEEMFDEKSIWEECIFDSTSLQADFTIDIHDDERMLAKLIQKGMEDKAFREMILSHTLSWENKNNKIVQFEEYDKLGKNGTNK